MQKQKGTPFSRGSKFLYILVGLSVVLAVSIGVLSAVNIAGDTVANIAAKTIQKETGMLLAVRNVTGNPIRGYVFSDVELSSEKGDILLFSAKKLGINLNFFSLFSASPRLSSLAVGGINMDLDQFMLQLQKIKMSDSGGSGTIPIDKIRLQDSRFSAQWGVVDVQDISARIEGSLLDISLLGAVNGIPVKGTLDVNAQGKNVNLNKADLRIGQGQLNLSGSTRPSSQTEAPLALDFQGSLQGFALSDAAAFWPEALHSQDFDGKAYLDFSIEGAGSNLVITSTVKFTGSRLGGYPVETLTGDLKYAGMRITFDNAHLSSLGMPIEGSFAMAMSPEGTPRIALKFDGSNASLSNLAKLYPAIGSVSGTIDRFTGNIQGPTNSLSGTVDISAPEISAMGKRISSLVTQIKLSQSDTAILNGKFLFEGAQAYVQGNIAQILTGARLDLTAKLVNLDIKRIKSLIPDADKLGLSGSLSAEVSLKGKPASLAVSGTLSSQQFTAMAYTLEKPSITFAFEKGILTIKDSGGTWNGLPIKAKGTLGPLSSKTPSVNLTAQLALKPENLKPFIPDIAKYQLQGDLRAGVKIEGKLPSPRIDLVASSPSLSALGSLTAKDIQATTALAGDISKLDNIEVNLSAGSLSASGLGLKNINSSIKKSGQKITLNSFSANSGEGSLSGSGGMQLGGTLDMAFIFQRIDLAALSKAGGAAVPLSGVLSGKLTLAGTMEKPNATFSGQVPRLGLAGLMLEEVNADITGNVQTLNINSLKANVGGAPLSAAGTVSLTSPIRADIDLSGNALDLAALTSGLPDMQGQLSGKADLKINLTATPNGATGKGSLNSAAVTAFNLKLSNLNVPLSFNGNSLNTSNATFDFYGGRATNSLTFNFSSMKFSNSLTLSAFDVNAVAQDATGGLGGKITGKGNLSLKIDGSAEKSLSYSGGGQFTLGEGGVSGFSGLNLVTKLYGTDSVRYQSVTLPLQVQTGKLILLKGGTATAPAGDPLYKSAKIAENGSIAFDKKLNLLIDANVNFQLINALAGGALGGVDALLKGGGKIQDIFSGKNLDSALKGALQGGREKGGNADFRDVTAKITGTVDKPSVALVKVGASSSAPTSAPEETPTSSSQAAPAPQENKTSTPEDILKDKIIDAISPQSPPQETDSSSQESTKPDSSNKSKESETPQEKIEREVIKGIDNLFKKK